MSTDVFGESELDTDTDFAWDEFLPDADDPESDLVETDESQLDLDDSEFAWDRDLESDDPEAEARERAEAARIEAAFTRMEDTVRRTFEPESELEGPPLTNGWSPGTAPDDQLDVEVDAEFDDEPELLLVDDVALHAAPRPDVALEPESEEPELLILDDVESESVQADPPPFAPVAATTVDPYGDEYEYDFDEPDVEEIDLGIADEPPSEAAPAWAVEPGPAWAVEPEPESRPEPVTAWSTDPGDPLAGDAMAVNAMADAEPFVETEFPVAGEAAVADSTEPQRKPRNRVRMATIAVACVVVVLGAGLVATRALHRTTAPAPRPATARPAATNPPAATVPASAALAAARLQTATDEADSATTTALAGLSSLPSFPTPTNVAAVVNPYVASLLLYQAYLSGATVPASARQSTATASEQIRNDLTFLNTINGLPPIQLGSFIGQFQADTTQLQATLGQIEHDLAPSGHP